MLLFLRPFPSPQANLPNILPYPSSCPSLPRLLVPSFLSDPQFTFHLTKLNPFFYFVHLLFLMPPLSLCFSFRILFILLSLFNLICLSFLPPFVPVQSPFLSNITPHYFQPYLSLLRPFLLSFPYCSTSSLSTPFLAHIVLLSFPNNSTLHLLHPFASFLHPVLFLSYCSKSLQSFPSLIHPVPLSFSP